MKIFGSISELVSAIFRKNSQAITLRPNQTTTYTASRDIQLPLGDADHALVSTTSADSLSNKTQINVDNLRLDGNTVSSTDTNGNIVLDPDGTGIVSVVGSLKSDTSIQLEETGAGTDTITLQAPASITASYTLTLPVDDGASGEVLSTNGSGVLSWAGVATTPAEGAVYSDGSALQTTGAFSGNANEVVGINSGATALEYKALATGTSGTDFAIAHTAGTVTFNLPSASGSNRGAVTTSSQTFAGDKTFTGQIITTKQPIISGNVSTISSTDYTITDTDGYNTFLVTTGASDRTMTLPAVANNAGRQLTFKKVDSGSGAVIIDTPSTETIDGAAQNRLRSQWSHLTIRSDGSNWYVVDVYDYLGTTSTDVTAAQNIAASATYFDAISFTCPEGIWEIWGSVRYTRNGATLSAFTVDTGFATVSGNSSPSADSRGYIDAGANLTTYTDWVLHTRRIRVSQTNNTTVYYLKGYHTHSSGTPQYTASMRLVRVG